MHDYVCFIAPIDFCVALSLVDETFCENGSFILKWFQPNSFGEMCFLEESCEKMKKIQILKIWRVPSTRNQGYAFNLNFCAKDFTMKIPVPAKSYQWNSDKVFE